MTLRPSTAPQRVPLPFPPASSLPDGPDPESNLLRAASPTVTRFLATAITDPLFESSAASARVAELVDFAAACRLDYATSLVAESASASVCPPFVGGECALGTDFLEDRQEEFECFAAAVPHLVSMMLAPEGDPDAPDIPTPRSYAEAIEGPYSSQWQATMDAEMASLKSTGTYVNKVPPHGANIVSGMWIFRVKRPPGSPPAFKARYVARGFSQRQGVDFFQTFSPTPKMTTLQVLLHVAAQRYYELHSLDFSTAFLQGSLHEEIWLRRPPGFTGSFPAGTQWSLRRPVYGLRQAPREWHDTLRTTIASLGFAPSTADPSLFLRTDATVPPFYVLVYVDNLVFATADTEALALVKSELQKRHTCTNLGELTSYLGLQITWDRAQRTITLTQSHMVQQVLQRFGFTYSSPQSTPLPTGHSLSAPPSDKSVEPSGPYLELVGCLMYLMTCTRPGLAYPLSLLAHYVAPGWHRKVHWDAVKRVLRYLCSTSGMGLVLGGRARVVLTGHADASWVDDMATQRSSQGYTFILGSGSVSLQSTRSSSVLSSSCEAEIYAGAMAAQELRWLTYLLTDLGEAPRSPPVLYVDNKSMLTLCQEHRTKHIALHYFLARELQQRGQLRLAYVASQANTADVFTKALQPSCFAFLDRSCYLLFSRTLPMRTCGTVSHTQSRCFSCVSDTWRAEFGNATELPRRLKLVRQRVDIFALDYDAILTPLSASAEGDCSRCVPPDPGVAAAALGASSSGTPPGTAPAEALHTFTLDSGASCCFFRDSTTLTPLPAPVPIRLADPSGGPVVARSSTVLPFPAVPSGSLSGLHLPSFSTNLVSTAALQDAMVTTITPGGQRVSIYTCTRTAHHLATFTRRPGSSLYTMATEPPQVAASAQVSASGQVAASCSCRLVSHQTLLWHPAWVTPPCHAFMASTPVSLSLVSPGLCLPYRPRLPRSVFLAPRGGSALLFTPPRFPRRLLPCRPSTWKCGAQPVKGEVSAVFIPWIRAVHLQLREWFGQDLPVQRLHMRDICRGEGITQSFTLPDSPRQNGIAERRIGLVMEVARTSMIHAAALHFLWPFVVRYAAHQLILWPCVSLPETSPTLRWTGKVGDVSVFRVWGSCAFVRDTSADKLSARAIPCVFLGFVPDAPGWQFYHPTSRRVLPSQDVTFDESVPFYRLFPYRSAPLPPAPLFLAPGPPQVDPLSPQGPGPSGESQVDPLPGTAPVQVVVVSGAARGAASRGAEPGGAESEGARSRGAELGGAEPEGVDPGGAEPRDTRAGGAAVTTEAGGTGGTAATGPGGARTTGARAAGTGGVGCAGAGDPTEPGAAGARGAGAARAGVGGTSAGGDEAAGARAVDPGAGDTLRPRPYFVPLLQQVLGVPSSTGLPPPFLCPPPNQSQPPLQPASPLLAPSPYTEQSGGLTERREPASRPLLPVCMLVALLVRVLLLSPARTLWHFSDRAHTASPTIARLLATAITDPSFESAAASALFTELLDFAAACRLYYATALVAESSSASPPSVGGECALGTDVLEDRQEDFECLAAAVPRFSSMLLAPEGDPDAPDIPTLRSYAEAITEPYSSQWQAAMDAEMASWKVKQPPGSPPAFNARYVARGFSQQQGGSLHEEIWLRRPPGFTGAFPAGTQWSLRWLVYSLHQAPREWHVTLRTTLAAFGFAPSTADPSQFLRTDTSLPPFYVLVYVDDLVFATADTKALTLVKSELQDRHTYTHLGELRSYLGQQITRDRARRTITLTQSHMVHQVLQRFGFQYSSPQLTPLSTSHSLSAPPSDESVEPSGLYPELVGCHMYLMTSTRPDLVYPLSLLARYVAPGRHRTVHWDAAKRVLCYLCSTSGMGSSCEAEIYAGAMAAQELRWLTYLLTDLGEQPRSPPVLYRGQLRLAYVATRANTADVFTKALPPGDHQRFATVLGL
ncbi:unnamed protein product, partial [Closterium sp. NIES-53]